MKKGVFFILEIIVLIGIISANFEVGEEAYQLTKTTYAQEANIEGWINMSFDHEDSSLIFNDSRGNSISLLNLLQSDSGLSEGVDYDCSSDNCEMTYSAENPESSKNFQLNNGDSKVIGILFTNDLSSIDSFSFDLYSNAPVSCKNQIEIDLFSDEIIDRGNTKFSSEACSANRNYGCFNDSGTISSFYLGVYNKMHCARIEFPAAAGFNIGANIDRDGYGGNINMSLYTTSRTKISGAECTLPAGNGETSCLIDYQVFEPKDYLVCVYMEEESSAEPQINGYEAEEQECGFYYNGASRTGGAFEIFMEPRQFSPVGTISIQNDEGELKTLGEKIQDYIITQYGSSMACGDRDCLVPITLTSNANQEITISNINLDYETTLGGSSQDQLYDFIESAPTIDSDFILISLNKGNFSVSDNVGNFTFSLDYDGEEIISEPVSVQEMASVSSIYPLTIPQGFPTEITAFLNSEVNVSSFRWYFGDGKGTTTTTNKATHTYDEMGTYTLSVQLGSGSKISNSSFQINVVSPEEAINETITQLEANLVKIKSQINNLDTISKKMLNSYLDLNNTEANLSAIKSEYDDATTNSEYLTIIGQLFALNIPKTIIKTAEAKDIPYYANENLINLEILKTIGGGDYDSDKSEKYKTAVLMWQQENVDAEITYRKYNSDRGLLLNVFELFLDGGYTNGTGYLIIKDMENLEFAGDYGEIEESGYYYIVLEDFPIRISFATTENVGFLNLPVFVSSNIDALPGIEEIQRSQEKEIRWAIMGLVLLVLILIGVIVYVVMQVWYKRKYEAYLFKNKNHLLNLAHYINNEKKQGKEDSVISSNLKKAGWNSEQVRYAIRKYAGKRTGMYELPIGKALKLFGGKAAPKPPIRTGLQRPNMPKMMQKKFFPDNNFKSY